MNATARNGAGDRPMVFTNARVIDPSRDLDAPGAVIIADRRIVAAGPEAARAARPAGAEIIDCRGLIVAPGLVDMRVFVGEPGGEHRETFASAGQAAAAGGVTTIVTMPDTDPVIDDVALVDFICAARPREAEVRVYPMAALTKGLAGREMTEFGLLREAGAVGFTDGRHTVTERTVMRRALTYARDFDALIMHHGADPDLVGNGVMNEGEVATRLGLPGIPKRGRDRHARARHPARRADPRPLPRRTDLLRRVARRRCARAKARRRCGHLRRLDQPSDLNENDIGPYRTFFKLSPPLRADDDRLAMVAALPTAPST